MTARATLHRAEFPRAAAAHRVRQGDGARPHLVSRRPTCRRSAFGRERGRRTRAIAGARAATRSPSSRRSSSGRSRCTPSDFESGFVAEVAGQAAPAAAVLRGAARRRAVSGRVAATRHGCRSSSRPTARCGPCFFHGAIGNAARGAARRRSSRATCAAFRESFDVGANPVCVRCVCSLKTSWRSAPWAS